MAAEAGAGRGEGKGFVWFNQFCYLHMQLAVLLKEVIDDWMSES